MELIEAVSELVDDVKLKLEKSEENHEDNNEIIENINEIRPKFVDVQATEDLKNSWAVVQKPENQGAITEQIMERENENQIDNELKSSGSKFENKEEDGEEESNEPRNSLLIELRKSESDTSPYKPKISLEQPLDPKALQTPVRKIPKNINWDSPGEEENSPKPPRVRPSWVPDSERNSCMLCVKSFSFFKRRVCIYYYLIEN